MAPARSRCVVRVLKHAPPRAQIGAGEAPRSLALRMRGNAPVLLLCAASIVAPAQALRRHDPVTDQLTSNIRPKTSLIETISVSGSAFGILFAADKVVDRPEFSLSFALPTKRIDMLADCVNRSVTLYSHGDALDAEDLSRLRRLDASFKFAQVPMEVCTAGRLLRHAMILLARAPLGVPLVRERRQARGRFQCLVKGKAAVATWTDSRGSDRMELTVGEDKNPNYGCMGRCAAGCATPSMRWTQACLNHDLCSYMNADGGTADPIDNNCADEFLAACDDYLFDTCDSFVFVEAARVPASATTGSAPVAA
uniref:DUF8213 domain-containing protein n=1 Tax=Alexandrium monilatum TaxID=311494 RepID=A0A7S4W7L6_9DINO